MTDEQIAEIAAGLTKAQRALILALVDDEYRDWGKRGMPGNSSTRRKIKDLTEPESARFTWMRRLTPTGLRLRAHLLANREGEG